jgi:hypothetical protein
MIRLPVRAAEPEILVYIVQLSHFLCPYFYFTKVLFLLFNMSVVASIKEGDLALKL